jgi:hypothetical protein
MSIKFVCFCGEVLEAQDDKAGRLILCPQCGILVGIPSLDPNQPIPQALYATTVFGKVLKRRRHHVYTGPLEMAWNKCLWYPIQDWPLVLTIATVLTVMTAAAALILVDEPLREFRLVLLMAFLAILPCGFLNCVLAAGLAGKSHRVHWLGWLSDLEWYFRSIVSWLLPFVSVPAPLAVAGFYYWLQSGDWQLVDWILLGQMGAIGSGYWLLAVLAFCRSNRLRDANPWQVAKLADRLGWRSLVVALMAELLFLSHGLLAFYTATVLHKMLSLGLLLAAGFWLSWLFWGTFMFRMVGVWCYQRRVV